MTKAEFEAKLQADLLKLKNLSGGFWGWTKLNAGHSTAWFLLGAAVGGTVIKVGLKLGWTVVKLIF